MLELSDEERERLLNAAKRIFAHKLVRIRGYGALVKRARDERIRKLFIAISDDETKYTKFWSERIEELGGQSEGAPKAYIGDLRARLMMIILGTKGFFEWAVVGEDEGIQDLAVQAEKIRNPATSETWIRFAADERMHLERLKSEVLGMKAWEIRGGGGVRDVILGANDGLVSILALVAGVFGIIRDPHIALLAGFAGLFAGSISMAVSSYQSSKSELEVLGRESRRRTVEKGKTPEEQRKELIKFYVAESFKQGEAEAIVSRIAGEKEMTTLAVTLEKLGLAPEELGNPVKSGVLTGVSFALAALVPVLPFAFPMNSWEVLIASIVATIAALFGVGALMTIFSRKNWFRSGLEMMIIGASAAAILFMIGTLLPF